MSGASTHEAAPIANVADRDNDRVREQITADAVLAVDDVAALLRVGRNTIYALVARNQIPHRRL
ncbi:MAG: helix-turn-helix domain-containing protein [Deltaproteobacteria bacterium]|nr:helix-turn-helix domain-containing protein [Deltaproteobacteria bacterium]